MERDRNHADESADGTPGEAAVTRRSVLAKSAATLGAGAVAAGGFVGTSDVAAAQVTEAGAIPEPTKWTDGTNFAGFMVHVGGSLSPEQERVAADCELVGSDTWPPDEMLAYDAQLINRKDDSTEQAETTLYIGETADVTAGKLYIVNRFNRCDSDFLGVSLEQIGLSEVNVDVETTEPGEGGSGAFGPGFGPLATVAGLLGGGALLNRRDREE
ncbi:hypothetical protein C475_02884 [Halosimplex carlsbadense 2-9-1]|uniref:Uncharacterized protein n=1 Tax=Halosimplex carlsbadense 2-9-1 TaxID=797114 RepID=M0D366_9EURY|nr:hypothetical protein [Halosimplex carlsbadense]ELZ29127.1 hypothetical protein C475_02884 [Halosimplex carlsbadense 2-9-1]